MKQLFLGVTSLIMLFVVTSLAVPSLRAEEQWWWVSHQNTVQSYGDYLRAWPAGKHVSEAHLRIEQQRWHDASRANTVQSYTRYLRWEPTGKHAAEAQTRIDRLQWDRASRTNTISSYAAYLQALPRGSYAAEARTRIEQLRWHDASRANTVQSYTGYLRGWPTGKHAAEARTRIERLEWDRASSTNTVLGYTAYLHMQPHGSHAVEARTRIDRLRWDRASRTNTILAYAAYLRMQPRGSYAAEARTRIEQLRWDRASNTNTILGYTTYLRIQPRGSHAAEARTRIERLHWHQATTANTIVSYTAYLRTYPSGRFAQQARAKITALRSDDAPFLAAQRQGTAQALETFLAQFPGHQRAAEARSALQSMRQDMSGRPIVDLLAQQKIEVQTQGAGVNSLTVTIRRLISHPVTVLIPVGTFFVSHDASKQNMVLTAAARVVLSDGGWNAVGLSVACTNISREAPSPSDSFDIWQAPNQVELQQLMPVLHNADVDYATQQAAIWIVTDDANYAYLGILHRFINGLDNGREIDETATARALQLLAQAGIPITQKAIWQDRQLILKGVNDEELRQWLQGRILTG